MKVRQELVDALNFFNEAVEASDINTKRNLLAKADVRLMDCTRNVKEGLVATSLNVAEEFIYAKLQFDIDVEW